MFRLSLCRNDDTNLAHSTFLKHSKSAMKAQPSSHLAKILQDLKAREEEREFREAEIKKELALCDKAQLMVVERHIRKMTRKMLLLTIDKPQAQPQLIGILPQPVRKPVASSMLQECCPSYLHLAAIMAEQTHDEKLTFGPVQLEFGQLTEDKIDWLQD